MFPVSGLVARDGANRLDLGLLPITDAVTLLRDLIGVRVAADPAVAGTLASQCALLPLALRVAAELAVARPTVPLAGLVDELEDQQRRLDLLNAGGDPRSAVRTVFSWSYRHLDTSAARLFRLIGLHPGPDLDPYAAAALAGTTVEQAGRLLDVLARAYLVHHTGAWTRQRRLSHRWPMRTRRGPGWTASSPTWSRSLGIPPGTAGRATRRDWPPPCSATSTPAATFPRPA